MTRYWRYDDVCSNWLVCAVLGLISVCCKVWSPSRAWGYNKRHFCIWLDTTKTTENYFRTLICFHLVHFFLPFFPKLVLSSSVMVRNIPAITRDVKIGIRFSLLPLVPIWRRSLTGVFAWFHRVLRHSSGSSRRTGSPDHDDNGIWWS